MIVAPPTAQPELPTLLIRDDGGMVAVDWPDVTREWWLMWANSPLSAGFTATDWSELRDTARLHALYWLGDKSVVEELRLRVAKFGATPEDRMRLRIRIDEDAKDAKEKPAAKVSSRRRASLLKLVAED